MILGAAATVAVAVTFSQSAAVPGDAVTVRASGFRNATPVYLYLAPAVDRTRIRSALDRRLVFAVRLRPRGGRANATFTVPPTASETYVAWCRGCRARTRTPLAITMPLATADACPVTIPRSGPPPGLQGVFHGNGALWTVVPPDGVYTPRPDSSSESIGTKLFWFAAHVAGSVFKVSGRRLDAPGTLQVHSVNAGTMSGFRGSGTWASAVAFPSPGCWQVTGTLDDFGRRLSVTISYVLKVVRP